MKTKILLVILACIISKEIFAQAQITSVTPLSGTSFTQVTINGTNLSLVDPSAFSVSIGNLVTDTAWVVSNTKIIAKVSSGNSGNVTIRDINNFTSSYPGFVYTPVAAVTNPGWSYVGNAGITSGKVYYVNAASGSNNVMYVAFIDSATLKTRVKKYANNSWTDVGSVLSDGKSIYPSIALTNTNTPFVAFIDSAHGGKITVKKFSSGSWVTLGTEGFAPASNNRQTPFSFAIDSTNVPYILSNSAGVLTVYSLVNNAWKKVGTTSVGKSAFSQANITISKKTNIPYVIYDDTRIFNGTGYQATVKKFDGTDWVNVGRIGFTNGINGVFYCDITVDAAGIPIVSMQEDDGFERQSIYKLINGVWTPVGYQHFSKGRAYFNNIAVDKKNTPYALFNDYSYNRQGSVMKFNKTGGTWGFIGKRGFVPFTDFFERNSLLFDTANTPMVAFSDKTQGGKLSVMKFNNGNNLLDNEEHVSENAIAKNQDKISIFPNPAHNVLTVNFNTKTANSLVQIINEKGEVMMQKRIEATDAGSTFNTDVSTLATGTYTCLLKSGNEVVSKQFLKQ